MKAISIQQPWAWAIIHAGKDIENRTWSTNFRGEVAIHATRMQSGWKLPPGVKPPRTEELTLKSIIGTVEIVDVIERSRSPWFLGPIGFVLKNPRAVSRPVPCRGNLRIWEMTPALEKAVRAALPKQSRGGDIPKPLASRHLTVTQGNLNHHHLYLTEALDLFAAETLGGARLAQAGKPVQIAWGDERIETDVVRSRNIFRRRGWVRRFFAANAVQAGDRVLLEQLGPYAFRISKAGK